MRFSNLKQDKGVAGLTILLSLVVMLFIIGLIVMIFTLMGDGLRTATYDATDVTVTNETGAYINETGYTVDGASRRGFNSVAITSMMNTSDLAIIQVGNFTISEAGVITNATVVVYTDVSVTYTYNWNADNTGTDVINDTTSAIAGVTDWFSIFIVIGAMVVLILLTVIIITAIRGSGMIQGGGTGAGAGNVGSA